MSLWTILQYSLSGTSLIVAAAIDARTKKIPNYLTVPLFVVSFIIALVFEPHSIFSSTLTAVGFLILGCIGAVGAGDAKLLMGLAFLNGWKITLSIFVIALLGLVAYYILFQRENTIHELKNAARGVFCGMTTQTPTQKLNAPFAPFLAFGYVVTILLY